MGLIPKQNQTPEQLSRVREILDRQDWDDLLPRLVRMSLYLLRVKNGGSPSMGSTCAGKTAEDYVMDAIMKVYQGERQWDPGKHPDLLFYFMGVLRSQIGHGHQHREHRSLVFVECPENHEQGGQTAWVNPEAAGDSLLENFQSFLSGEPVLDVFVDHIAQGCKPREIAQRMGLDRAQIYNLRKLMKRRFMEFFHQRDRNSVPQQRKDHHVA